jgi:glutaredoxin
MEQRQKTRIERQAEDEDLMVKVRVFTLPNCPRCPEAKALVKEIGKEYEIEIEEIDLEKDLIKGLQFGVASTPSIVVNEKIVSRGWIPKKEDLIKEIINEGGNRRNSGPIDD